MSMSTVLGGVGTPSFQPVRAQSECNVIQRERDMIVGRVHVTDPSDDGYANAEIYQTQIEDDLHQKATRLRDFSILTQQRVRDASRKKRELKKLKERSMQLEARHRLENLEDCAAKYLTNQNKKTADTIPFDDSDVYLMQFLPKVLVGDKESPRHKTTTRVKDEVVRTQGTRFISPDHPMFSGPTVTFGHHSERPPLVDISNAMNTSVDPFQLSSVSSASETIAEPGNSTRQFLKAMRTT
eukprot:TRINITY_DN8378_c0_g1_i1.p1 TRINITY_DN8378_c0_g1~~TRINITY_DN8378_c0_g1_i1.p1  ORF type:complete len:240 (+),score=39.07 TRINITY_DN8378_c0_g1_i1:37-756(+)